MAVSKVDICNQALGHLRADPIDSFNEKSNEARFCRTWYEQSLNSALSYAYWDFAKTEQALAYHQDLPPASMSWAYRYQLPSDLITPIKIINPTGREGDLVPFDLATSEDRKTMSLLTNERNATLEYIFKQNNISMYSPAFIDVFSLKLAHNLAMPITQKPEMKRAMATELLTVVPWAAAHDANQGVEHPERDAAAIRARA